MVPWVGADHWEGWTQGRGWADLEMPNPGNGTARSLELGPTGDTPRSHGEYSVSSRDRRAVCLSSLPSHTPVRGYPRSRVLFTGRPRLWCVTVTEWFPRAFSATVAEKVPGLKGRGLFPAEACYSPIPTRWWLQQSIKQAEKMDWCKRGIRYSEVVCRKSGTSKTPRK